MAKCGCAGSTCGCKVTGTGGVVVTGTGTAQNPYVVGLNNLSIANNLEVDDTDTLELNLLGSGTAIDPFVLSGNVHLSQANPFRADRNVMFIQPAGFSSTNQTGLGTFTVTGTVSASGHDLASPSAALRTRRIAATAAAAATTAVAGFHYSASPIGQFVPGTITDPAIVGTPNDPTLYVRFQGGIGAGATNANHRFFMGLTQTTTAPTDVPVSSLGNFVGIGYEAADSFIQIMHNDGAGLATKIATSIPKPVTDNSNMLVLTIVALPGQIAVSVIDLQSGLTGAAAIVSDAPFSTTAAPLYPRLWASAGGTSSAPGVNLHSFYSQSRI